MINENQHLQTPQTDASGHSELTVTALPDSLIDVRIVAGPRLNQERALFENAVSSLNANTLGVGSLAVKTPTPNHWWVSTPIKPCQDDGDVCVSESFAIAGGLIEGEHIPDDWMCAVLSESNECLYLTCFSGTAIFGRVTLPEEADSATDAGRIHDMITASLSAHSIPALPIETTLDALFPTTTSLHSGLHSIADYPVEELPIPRGALIGRGLKFFAERCSDRDEQGPE